MDASLEIPVARKHRRDNQFVLLDGAAHRFRERPRVADAGGAAIADDVETERLQIRQQTGLRQIPGDHLGTGGKTRLDVTRHIETELDGFAREQPAPSITDGFEVLVQEVIAAMTTAPLSIRAVTPSTATATPPSLVAAAPPPLLGKAPG